MGKTRFDWVGPGLVIAGRYRIDAPLGEGGYGAVYIATQTNLGRRVALKLLHPEVLVRERARERFEREARITQQLAHPNIVRLFDFGTTETGLPFIVCELLEGRSLEREIRDRGAFSFIRVAHVTQQILKALAEAHGRGIVHRDIKPANIFLCDYAGESDFVKVLDFGIAAAPLESGTAGLTQEGVSLGTPAYMSPEQVLDQALDGRADLYSVGLVMAEMLTGIPVFQGTVAMQVALRQIEPAPVPLPPSVLEGPLGAFIHRATQKDKSHRFASALEMLEALRNHMVALGHGIASAPHAVVGSRPHLPSSPSPYHAAAASAGSGGSASMPLAAPAVPPPARSGSRTALWIAGAILGAIAIAGATYGITIASTSRDKQPRTSRSAQVAVSEDDPEDDIDAQIEQYEKQVFDNLFKNPSLTCHPLADAGAFAVKGLTLAEAVRRAELAGYHCTSHSKMSADYGSIMFLKDLEPGFQLTYMGGTQAPMADKFPQSVTLGDPAAHRYFVIMALDQSIDTAKRAGEILVKAPPASP